MLTEPTIKEIEEISQIQEFWSERYKNCSIFSPVSKPSQNGLQLLEDTEMILSMRHHQEYIETALSEFHAHIANYILTITER